MKCSHAPFLLVAGAVLTLFLAPSAEGQKLGLFGHRNSSSCVRYSYLEPENLPPGTEVPVILYLHGAGAAVNGTPHVRCGTMLQRLADAGCLVIMPHYIQGEETQPHLWQNRSYVGFRAALTKIRSRGRVVPDLDRLIIIGQSLGGPFGLKLASIAPFRSDLPEAKAIVLQDGAGYAFAPYFTSRIRDVRHRRGSSRAYDDFSGIPDDTLLVALIGEETWNDEMERGERGGCIVYGNANAGGVVSRGWHTSGILPENRHAFIMMGDHSVHPPVLADHEFPWTPKNEVDKVFWRVTDTVVYAVANGQSPDFSAHLAETWSDGSPQMIIPEAIPEPVRFVWDYNGILGVAPWARWFMPPQRPLFGRLFLRR